jgi:hypothetical protein
MRELKTCFKRVDYDLAGLLSRRMGADVRTACLAGRLAGDGLRRFFGATPSSHGRHYPSRLREFEVA